ncbi:actin-related protein 8 isoform X2 [Chrysoperla carnea]|nr:actin-related protein 8 isoform X2 [Chrysoperla carnea]
MPLSNEYVDPEHIQTKSIIIIHPGSLYLKIGRASDLNPHTVLHAIARRRKRGGLVYKDTFITPAVNKSNKDVLQEMEETRLNVSHTLQSCLQSDGRRRYATPPQQIAAFNRRSQPEQTEEHIQQIWVKPESDVDIIVGNDILQLDPALDFNIHFPIKRGELNIHKDIGGSLTSVLNDLETIWLYCIQSYLNIPSNQLNNYKVVLIVPDIYNRIYLKEYMNLLLNRMGFSSCFLVQDHVAATFGAGLGYACVIDVGDQKTSVSCVEDGISHRNTRVRMEYGGADITQTFYWLLQKCAFPYKECSEDSNKLDAMLLRKLKEDFCHVNLDICGAQEKSFLVNNKKYTLQVGDECIVAPLSLFTPELFGITGKKYIYTQKSNLAGDPEDPHDGNYLRETSRRAIKENESANMFNEFNNTMLFKDDNNDSTTIKQEVGADEDIVVDAIIDNTLNTIPYHVQDGKEFTILNPEQVIGLDQAVLQSIERCPNEDLKRKMYACILVVGGGMKFIGIGTWLQNRISLQIPYIYRSEQMDIITQPKDMDPSWTTWKGAAIMSCLESANELWIYQNEWNNNGVKILRERAPFM